MFRVSCWHIFAVINIFLLAILLNQSTFRDRLPLKFNIFDCGKSARSSDWPYDAYTHDVVTNEEIIKHIREHILISPTAPTKITDVHDTSEGSLISNWVVPALFRDNLVRYM